MGQVQDKVNFDVQVFSRDLETNYSRNVRLLDAIDEIFGLRKKKGLNNLKKTINDAKISELYVTVQKLWSVTTNVADILPEPEENLRAFFMGDADPEQLLLDVNRLSLYVDEILLINPLRPPFTLNDEFNPGLNPSKWRTDTLRVVYVLKQLEPLIRSHIVHLIPEPGTFEPRLLEETAAMGAVRLQKVGGIERYREDFEESSHKLLVKLIAGCKPAYRLAQLQRMFPEKNKESIEELYNKIENSLRGVEGQLIPEKPSNDEILVTRSGSNLDTALLICALTGSFPATNLPFRWREISFEQELLSEEAKVWAPVTKAFGSLRHSFLNNVPTSFVSSLRSDGRLESFRGFLRKMWNESCSEKNQFSDSDIRTFCDEIIHQHKIAAAEWDSIKRSLTTQLLTATTASIIGGALKPDFAPLGIAATGLTQGIKFLGKRKDYRKKIPMSVFVDLEERNKSHSMIGNVVL